MRQSNIRNLVRPRHPVIGCEQLDPGLESLFWSLVLLSMAILLGGSIKYWQSISRLANDFGVFCEPNIKCKPSNAIIYSCRALLGFSCSNAIWFSMMHFNSMKCCNMLHLNMQIAVFAVVFPCGCPLLYLLDQVFADKTIEFWLFL